MRIFPHTHTHTLLMTCTKSTDFHYSIEWFVFVMWTQCVPCEVRTYTYDVHTWISVYDEKLNPENCFLLVVQFKPTLLALWSMAWVCGRSLVRDCGFESDRAHGRLSLWVVCVLRYRSLCLGSIVSPEESYRVSCVQVWSRILNIEA